MPPPPDRLRSADANERARKRIRAGTAGDAARRSRSHRLHGQPRSRHMGAEGLGIRFRAKQDEFNAGLAAPDFEQRLKHLRFQRCSRHRLPAHNQHNMPRSASSRLPGPGRRSHSIGDMRDGGLIEPVRRWQIEPALPNTIGDRTRDLAKAGLPLQKWLPISSGKRTYQIRSPAPQGSAQAGRA